MRGFFAPGLAHVLPEQAGEQEAGGYGFAFAYAAVGVAQGAMKEGVAGALHGKAEQRVDAFVDAEFLQLGNAG